MNEMVSDEELLMDTSFDREIVPRDQVGDLLVSLFKNKAFKDDSAILLSKYPIKMEELEPLIKNGRIELVSRSPIKIYLTRIGRLVALGELSLREREKKK